MVTMIRSDLDFILAQIKIAEADARHDADPVNNPSIVGTLIPNTELPWGLRRVDGSNNNLLPGQDGFGAADQPFPRGTTSSYATGTGGQAFGPPIDDTPGPGGNPIDFGFLTDPTQPAGPANPPLPLGYIPTYATSQGLGVTAVPGGVNTPNGTFIPAALFAPNYLTNHQYGVPTPDLTPNFSRDIEPGDVVDADPRIISNLIVDQTLNNPAAVFKALQVAGVEDDPTTAGHETMLAMQSIVDAAGAVRDARADLAAAIANTTGPNAPTVAAYEAFAATSDGLVSLATIVDTATSDLVTSPSATTLADAQTALGNLLGAANTILSGMTAVGVNAPADDLAAVQSLINTVSLAQFQLSGINAADGLDGIEALLAGFAETIGNGLVASATTLDGQLDATLASLDTAVGTAQAALTAAETALTNLISPHHPLTNPTGVSAGGLATEASPLNDILKATLVIENTAPDEGLSAPFNGWMTLFGQFFDHGLDLVGKGGFGTVYIPLQPDDPLYVPGSATNFMAVTRATLGPDGQPVNKVTPFVDQNQTYTSHSSHQFFLREYELRDDGAGNMRPHATGLLLNGNDASGGGIPTWADVKAQALNILGIELNDHNIGNVPEIMMDAYGNFIPGANGFPQLVRSIDSNGVVTAVEGSIGGTPARTADGQVSTGHAFLDDIAHTANPGATEVADGDSALGLADAGNAPVSNTGFFDNELLDRHYITGDGRGNENIGLTAVHHVFHSEHNRQIDLVKNLVLGEAQAAAAALALDPLNVSLQAAAAEKLAFLNEWTDVDLTAANVGAATNGTVVWDGERLFQAAKFPTEMQYQHLVFEEFARKVQPAVNIFNDYDATLDPAILAEFAHTVYRFGHSMLTETVDRFDPNWEVTNGGANQEQIGLISAFLNPLEFAASGADAEAAAGAIVRGMTRQTGMEIDEFVTEALRNNLVGLPLDLAAINIARGRETGVPSLNEARAQFYAGSGDAQVKPYESWADFALNIKNPASVVNFIAAYGTHSTITSATTVEDKRDAAMLLVLGGAGEPADRVEFLNATGDWTRDNDASLGGLNNIDFWIGGLAEKKLIFGGMLGSTFNFVFETQLEALQNGDRFYYLSRLANLNLTAQLENNKFSELIHRNTDATHLPGDAFARPDYFLEVDQTKQFNGDLLGADPTFADIGGGDPFLGALNTLVIRDVATNKLQYNGAEHVVLGGTDGNDILIGGLGDDTLWGDAGDDRLEGGDGNDFHFGGDGDDIITDLFGVNEIRANGGNDVVSVGPGINLIITDTGDDIIFGGRDDDEMLAGQGNDFVFGGDGVEFVVAGEGSDWIESGNENSLLLGDNGDLIQGLPIKIGVANAVGGDDILIAGSGGNADFDAEAGDDIMVAGFGTDRFFGAQGFDWVTHMNATMGVEADMSVLLFQPPVGPASPSAILDRYATVEGLTGSQHGDILRGDSRTLNGEVIDIVNPEADVGNPESHILRNIDLIDGLREFLPIAIGGAPPTELFDGGNIILGGGGSDVIEGRGGDDLIGGDHYLNVRIEVTPDATRGQTFGTFSVSSISEIQSRIVSGEIKVGQLRMVREILDGNTAGEVDTAEFSGLRSQYLVEGIDAPNATVGAGTGPASDVDGDGFISVRHLPTNQGDLVNNLGLDGHDRLKNIERVRFADQEFDIVQTNNFVPTGNVGITGLVRVGETISINLAGVVDLDNVASGGAIVQPFTVYWQGEVGADTGIFQTLTRFLVDTPVPVTGNTLTITPDMLGVNLRAVVQYVDGDNVIERVVSIPQTVLAPDGTGGTLIVPDPAVAIGPDLAGTVVDGVTLVAGDQGILEDLGAFGTTPAGTPLTFTVDSLLVNIRAANPGATIDMVRGLSGNPILTPRVADGDPLPGTLTFDNLTQIFTFVPAQDFNGGITFEFEVTTPAGVPAGAEATLEVFGVNDAPVAGTNTGNLAAVDAGTTFTFTEAQLIGNATDVDGDNLELVRSADPLLVGADQFVLLADEAQGTIVLNADGSFTFTAAAGAFGPVVLEYSITDRIATVATTATFTMGRTFNGVGNENDAVTGTIAGDILNGNGGADVLNGGDGNDQLTGGAGGPDRLNGQGGDDTIVYDVGDGTGAARDIVDGGLGGTDTYVVNGSNTDDDFTVYAAAAWVALGGGRALQSAASDIVITRNGTGNGNVIAELDEIEEIVINTGAGTDTVDIVGDFSPTNLAFNTIHVNNEEGEDIVDVTGIESDHRTVLAGDGTITGKRDQDQQVAYAGETTDDNDVDFDDDATDATGDDDDETFTGNDDANEIHGGGGEDDIYGGHGNDKLEGGSGSDNVDGGSGNDSFVATIGDGNDQYSGGAGADTYDASATTKGVVVELGKDRAVGSEIGTDIIRSVENVIGGSGDDALVGDDANNKIWGNAGNDVIGGRAGNDLLFGGADNDYINGSRGNDQLFGDSGADTLRGGMGNDRMTGGVGNDSFRFNAGFGNDVITDFDANASGGQDKLDLRDMGIRSSDFANRVDIIDQGSDVLIRVDDSNTIRLKDVANVNSVTINDFVLFGG